MKIVSNDFKSGVNQFGRQLDTIITYGQTTLTRDNIYNINPNFHTNIMETLMKSMNVEVDTLIPIGTRINVQSGIKVGNNYEYINYGYYTVKEYEKDENNQSYKMKCYDDMMLTMVDYDLQVTYPISVKNLLSAICTHFDFTLNTQTFVNDDNLITTDVFSGMKMTYRDVLSELAIATCSTIEIENGIMYLKYPTNTNLVINEDILNDVNVAISKRYGPVNRLIITKISGADTELREDTTSIEMYGATELKISDKQIFSTEATRDNLIDEIWDYINDFQYYLCDLDTQGLMYVEALDKFNISINNTLYHTIALNDETNISDGLNEEIFNEEPIINQDEYKYSKSEDKSLRNAFIEVDKQNAVIRSTVQEVQQYDARITENENAINGTPTYQITTDETFQSDKPYYKLVDDEYILLVEGTDYNDGDTIANVGYDVYDVIYVDSMMDTVNNSIQNQINDAIQIVQSTLLEQTSEKFTMWFEQTGVQQLLDETNNLATANSSDIETIKAYIDYGIIPSGEPYAGSPYIELGASNDEETSQTKLRILNNRIQFLTNGVETAYISNNTLYINESTVLTKQTIGNTNGQWITDVDSQGNLNTYWGG